MVCIHNVAAKLPVWAEKVSFINQFLKRLEKVVDTTCELEKRNFKKFWDVKKDMGDGVGTLLLTDKSGVFTVIPKVDFEAREFCDDKSA